MNRSALHNQRVFTGAMWIYNQHRMADYLLQKKELDVNVYEYSREPYRKSCGKLRYIGLRAAMDQVLNNPVWKEAYQMLVDYGMLELDKDWDNPTHYRLIYDFDVIKGKGE